MHRTFVIAALLVLIGCAGSGRVRYDSPQEAYEKGKELYERGKYDRAVEYLQGAFDFGRAHEVAADAQLLLARSFAANTEYLLAANEYNRFIQIYRTDERVPLAEFENVMTYYHRSPQYELDQTETENAVQQFQLFIDRYPEDEHVPQAEAMIDELREKLARKDYQTAGLYERRELFEAAGITYERVFDGFPDTVWADDALVGAMRVFSEYASRSIVPRQAERYQRAVDNYDRLVQLFPDSPHLPEAERIITGVRGRLESLAGAGS